MGVYYNSFKSLQCGQKYVDAAFYSPFMSQTVNKKSRTVAIVPHPLPAWCTLLQITGINLNFLKVFWTEKSSWEVGFTIRPCACKAIEDE